MRRKLLALPVLLAGLVSLSHGQPPGGFGGGGERGGRGMFGGGGAPDPEMIWGFMSKGQPTINLNDPANARTKDRMVQQGQAIPADGILTKEAFKANFQASMEKRMAGGGGAPGGATMQFGGGGPGGGGFGGKGGGGFDPSQMTDDQLKMMMRRYDTDGDGRISAAEGAASDRLRDSFAQYDTNRDGFIDTAEYRVYMTARMQQRGQDQTQPQPMPAPGGAPPGMMPQFQPPGQPGQPAPNAPAGDAEPARPEVFRYGKLPKGAPPWMLAPTRDNSAGLDADRDGQIGLYEWRRAGKRTSEFVEMDLNGDGYVTYQEWMGFKERQIEKARLEDPDAPAPVVITPAGGSSGGGDRERGKDRERKGPPGGDDRKGPKRNPFDGGGGKKGRD